MTSGTLSMRQKFKQPAWVESIGYIRRGIRKTIDWYLENSVWLGGITSGTYRDYYKKQYS